MNIHQYHPWESIWETSLVERSQIIIGRFRSSFRHIFCFPYFCMNLHLPLPLNSFEPLYELYFKTIDMFSTAYKVLVFTLRSFQLVQYDGVTHRKPGEETELNERAGKPVYSAVLARRPLLRRGCYLILSRGLGRVCQMVFTNIQ
jgi:hypothetical protein